MGLFSRSSTASSAARSWIDGFPSPEEVGCNTTNVYEITNWRNFCQTWDEYARKVVRWERLASDYYRATLNNDNVIFYDAFDGTIQIHSKEGAEFKSEVEWRREFSRRLRRMMDFSGMDQSQLAEATGYSQSSICGYLTCKKLPSSYALFRLASALNCSVDFLVNFA